MPGTGTGCGLELLPSRNLLCKRGRSVSMPSWAWVVTRHGNTPDWDLRVSMPSWAWVVTSKKLRAEREMFRCFNALMGLSCYICTSHVFGCSIEVSMPSWAWVVTARMSNILNFSWYFLCIPAIYKCILAYLPIFFNQLSKFLRCESLVLFWELAFRTTLLSFFW